MLRTRIIPCLQLIDESLVKTVKFGKHSYIGDPVNTVRIFNELEVDELCFLDIRASKEKRKPNLDILRQIADECFMPLSYGGGVTDPEMARLILSIGFEKIVLNTAAYRDRSLITRIAEFSGKQSVIGSIDVSRNLFGKYHVYVTDGSEKTELDPVEWAQELESLGAGELLVTSINQDGTWKGFDIEILKKITAAVGIPVIANGGAGQVDHISEVVKKAKVSAVALGSMVVFQGEGLGVLVNFPDRKILNESLN